jgi:hypothetical protein
VINPFNARMSTPLVPTICGIYVDGDTVIIPFDAAVTVRDGKPLSQYLYLVFSDEGPAGRQSNRFLRHQGSRRILEARVSSALKDGPAHRSQHRQSVGAVGSIGICLCGQPKR